LPYPPTVCPQKVNVSNISRYTVKDPVATLNTCIYIRISTVTLCIISVDRFIGVTRPLQYNVIVTRAKLIVATAFVWATSMAILLCTMRWEPLAPIRKEDLCPNECHVGNELKYVLHSVIFSFFIPLFVILFLYYQIYRVTKQRERGLLRSLMFSAARSNASLRQHRNVEAEPSSGIEHRHQSVTLFLPLRYNRNTSDTSSSNFHYVFY
jgi:hypothetical protein